MKIVLGSDHGGSSYLREVDQFLQTDNIETITPCGFPMTSVDYPDIVRACVKSYDESGADFIILICGSGVGVSIAANRYHHIRALVTSDLYQAKLSREHNHANCICFGERLIGLDQVKEVIKVFINTSSSKETRHLKRVEKLGDL